MEAKVLRATKEDAQGALGARGTWPRLGLLGRLPGVGDGDAEN